MRRATALLAVAGLLVAACGGLLPTASGPLVVTGRLPGGQMLTLTVDDRTGLVEGVSFVQPDPDYLIDQSGGIALKNVAGDPPHLLVTWEGAACETTKVDRPVDRFGPGFSITVREPDYLQRCSKQSARQKTIELDFSSAMPAGSVEGTWLAR